MGLLKTLELEFQHDEVEKFLHFFRILCDNFEPLIIKISQDKERYKEGLREIDTLAHNLAWAARRLELNEIVNFCEFCEELVAQAMKFEGPASDEFVEWLFLMDEQFHRYCQNYEKDELVLAYFNPLLVKMPNTLSK
ncbi:histidine phosphotransferase [Campylobacter troglodytis]|uniref:histidine phosphotransferase n=1 Tax=Campylobacter troglodytis TaxID=654363 RepID=UPI0011596111|nr:histidine phosphotransferase [Campylobacter troglodytis]TQR54223.1 histidine phosphotransferase [Campylobacter troglodytis]